ncbi:MAG: SOS response-associated peptidase [Bauldia sp.]
MTTGMCGRFALTATPEEVQALFGYLDAEQFPPRYNIAPTQPIAVVRVLHGDRRLTLMRWGLVPAFVKDPKGFPLLFNARSESAATRPAFANAMRYRRCLIPASGFYEWRKGPGRQKQPFWLRPRASGLIAFAGLWETWSDRDGGEIDTATILTTDANRTLAPIHDRMPLIVSPADFDRWLKSTGDPSDDVTGLLRPAPDALLEAIPVGARVNKADNDGPELQIPVVANDPAPPAATRDLFDV